MSDDEDMRRAIELSLQEAGVPSQTSHDDDGDDDPGFREELRRAMEESMGGAIAPQKAAASSSSSTQGGGFLSERARMEQERLQRQKRRRIPGRDDSPPAKRQASESEESTSSSSSRRPIPIPISANHSASTQEEIFWDGEIRQLANRHVTPSKDTRPLFRMSNILGNVKDIAFAIVSAYCYDVPWLYSFFDPTTPVIIVTQPDESGAADVKQILPTWIKTSPFLRNGRGCMHIKFMLLFYTTGRLRVVVTTANMIQYDWRDIENTAWVQDVPLLQTPIPHDPKATDFPATFQRVLKALNVVQALAITIATDHPDIPLQDINQLRTHWDWSKISVALVPSLAGKHEGWPNVVHTGHTGLMMAVRNVGGRAGLNREVLLECQGSSIGAYSTQWMNEFYCSAQGESAQTWLDGPRAARSKLPYPSNVKILFPSLQTVKNSVMREPGGGTMFCRASQWTAAKFPRELFHDSNSKRGGVLMHSKMILATFRARPQVLGGWDKGKRKDIAQAPDSEDEDPRFASKHAGSSSKSKVGTSSKGIKGDDPMDKVDETLHGWVYVGSHNFTPSAWGTLSGTGFTPSLNITNFELGILIPLRTEEQADRIACWERPPRKYDLRSDKPWMQDEFMTNGQNLLKGG